MCALEPWQTACPLKARIWHTGDTSPVKSRSRITTIAPAFFFPYLFGFQAEVAKLYAYAFRVLGSLAQGSSAWGARPC